MKKQRQNQLVLNRNEKNIEHRRNLHRKHQLKYRRKRREICKANVCITLVSNETEANVCNSDEEEFDENDDGTGNIDASGEHENYFETSSAEQNTYSLKHYLETHDTNQIDLYPVNDDEKSSSDFGHEACDDNKEVHMNSVLIANFIRRANLNHSDTTHLLHLIQHLRFDEELPTTESELWNLLDVEFNFNSYVFCSSCLSKLIKISDVCKCNPSFRQINSELIVLNVATEIKHVIRQNINLIDWYRKEDCQIISDIVQG
ncbi:unnamed protein product [Rotaria sordida]|uniref:Uncharacterized protein n=1 Tax=Rotaria sordida TaxID=392033 RepID=A0A819XV56_9BILA|nr:unnamed protein product [Rotaria sordida]CAF4148199.1 unnamed protein product [Rotaria sordida]